MVSLIFHIAANSLYGFTILVTGIYSYPTYFLIDNALRDSMLQIFYILLPDSQRLSLTLSLRKKEKKLTLRIENPIEHL